jgi:hypothetical protein
MNSALVRELMDGQPVAPEKLRRLLYSDVNALAGCAEAVDLEADYLIEAMLERACEDLLSDSVIGQRVRDYWLEIQHVPGGSAMELVVRAAEFLAAQQAMLGFEFERNQALAASDCWRERLVSAWAVRNRSDSPSVALRDQLQRDQFQDADGIYLVREAAGWIEE